LKEQKAAIYFMATEQLEIGIIEIASTYASRRSKHLDGDRAVGRWLPTDGQ
jgi:hypothetical protein